MKFIPNNELDVKRIRLRMVYDKVFARIQAAEKGSICHRQLLRREWTLYQATKKFLEKNAFYFGQKRRDIFINMEKKRVFGDDVQSEGHPNENNSMRFEGKKVNRFEGIFDKIGEMPCTTK